MITTVSRSGSRLATSNSSICIFLLLFVLGGVAQLQAAQAVKAKYVRIEGQEVVVEVSVSEPPPASLIVIQNLPVQILVTQAQPSTKSTNSDKGEVKWLLKGIKAGTLTVRMTLDRSVSSEEISGEIRYRESGGDMVIIPITKP